MRLRVVTTPVPDGCSEVKPPAITILPSPTAVRGVPEKFEASSCETRARTMLLGFGL